MKQPATDPAKVAEAKKRGLKAQEDLDSAEEALAGLKVEIDALKAQATKARAVAKALASQSEKRRGVITAGSAYDRANLEAINGAARGTFKGSTPTPLVLELDTTRLEFAKQVEAACAGPFLLCVRRGAGWGALHFRPLLRVRCTTPPHAPLHPFYCPAARTLCRQRTR